MPSARTFADRVQKLESAGIMRVTAATITLTSTAHAGKTIVFGSAAGTVATLPAATGTMDTYKFIVGVTVTSNADTLGCVGSDEFAGVVFNSDTDSADAAIGWAAVVGDTFDDRRFLFRGNRFLLAGQLDVDVRHFIAP